MEIVDFERVSDIKDVCIWTVSPNMTRWWFQIFSIFTPIWERFPIWLIFFKWVETTNQMINFFKITFWYPKKLLKIEVLKAHSQCSLQVCQIEWLEDSNHSHLFDRSTPKKATEKTHATMPEILPYDLFAGHIGKWAPEMMCLGEIGPLQGRNIRLMEEIRRSPVDMVNVPII